MIVDTGAGHSPSVGLPNPLPVEDSPVEGPAAAYRQFFRPVWRNLRRLGVPDDQIEDAVQDVFLVVHRRWGEFEGRSSLTTWIFGILLNVVQGYRRAGRRHAARLERARCSSAVLQTTGDCPAAAAERREATERLHAVLSKLSEDQRTLLVLVELEQLPIVQVAPLLGVNINTCRSRLRQARRAFAVVLARYQGGGEPDE